MERENKFIILVTSYNDEDWVEYNLASILNQTYSNYKVMYYNDASEDNTYQKVLNIVEDNPKFTLHNRSENKGALHSYLECLDTLEDEDILVCLSGDDWLFNDEVLENLNNFYNEKDVWMTYGKLYCWDGVSDITEGNPQNTTYPEFVHKHKLYKKDVWRASHLRTFKGFLVKKLPNSTTKSTLSGEYFDHASDLAITYPCLEMCGKDKIGVVDFPTYVYNTTPKNHQRTKDRESNLNNVKYEDEIRNRKTYKTLKDKISPPIQLPQINVIGYFQENNYIPKDFSFVYEQEKGEFDVTLITDMELLDYLVGNKKFPKGKIIADLHESPLYNSNQQQVYNLVKENHEKFALILTHNIELLGLPNAQLRLCLFSCLNKNIHTKEWPILSDETLRNIYPKSKLLSCISSNKSFLEGHKKRLKFVNHIMSTKYKTHIDMFGVGFNPIKGKIEGLKDYKFSIAIENSYANNECSEKISDCFLTGVIPIYYGAPNIGEYFDINGIFVFNTKEELENIVKDITLNGDKIYKDKTKSIRNNYELAIKYTLNSDQIFNQYLKHIIND
jgi:glycosyltransferase involved in cell wall biosynthesis